MSGARSFRVHGELDVFAARREAQLLAAQLSFDAIACGEIAIAVSELATNILKHASHGEIVLEAVSDAERGNGVRVVAIDPGPPFRDLSVAMLDGHGDGGRLLPEHFAGRKGIASGLGAVTRFMDSFECITEADGKRITAVRYQRRARAASGPRLTANARLEEDHASHTRRR
jgi:anti-sigma regulatory factor (Ser/Thr protein kinase)